MLKTALEIQKLPYRLPVSVRVKGEIKLIKDTHFDIFSRILENSKKRNVQELASSGFSDIARKEKFKGELKIEKFMFFVRPK